MRHLWDQVEKIRLISRWEEWSTKRWPNNYHVGKDSSTQRRGWVGDPQLIGEIKYTTLLAGHKVTAGHFSKVTRCPSAGICTLHFIHSEQSSWPDASWISEYYSHHYLGNSFPSPRVESFAWRLTHSWGCLTQAQKAHTASLRNSLLVNQ